MTKVMAARASSIRVGAAQIALHVLGDAVFKGGQAVAGKAGGKQAVQAQLVEQFIDEFGQIVSKSNVSVVPSELANIQGFFQGMGEVSQKIPTTNNEKK